MFCDHPSPKNPDIHMMLTWAAASRAQSSGHPQPLVSATDESHAKASHIHLHSRMLQNLRHTIPL
jgi:hypothetical protein